MEKNPIAVNVRKFRESRRWSQEELALVSGVDVRTIQRIESGRPMSTESLKAIAAAFDTTPDALSASEDELKAVLAEFRKRFSLIDVVPIERGSDLHDFLGSAHAYYVHRAGSLTDDQADVAADFEQELKDYIDVWGDLEPVQRRDAEKHFHDLLDRLRAVGLSVSMGTQAMNLRPQEGGSLLRIHVLYAAIAPGATALRVLVRMKELPVSLA